MDGIVTEQEEGGASTSKAMEPDLPKVAFRIKGTGKEMDQVCNHISEPLTTSVKQGSMGLGRFSFHHIQGTLSGPLRKMAELNSRGSG